MKLPSILCLSSLLSLAACSGDEGSSSSGGITVPEGSFWQLTLDGVAPYKSNTLFKSYASGELVLMGMGKPGKPGITLMIPMASESETGTFETGVELKFPGVPGLGDCEHDRGPDSSSVTVDIPENSRELFIASFTFTDFNCEKSTAGLSGSGTISKKRPPKN